MSALENCLLTPLFYHLCCLTMPPKTAKRPSSTGHSPRTPNQVGNIPKKGLVGLRSQQGGNPRSADNGVTHVPTSLSTPTGLSHTAAVPVGGSFCGSCELHVDDDGIGCDKCQSWFHPTPLCLGLSERVIDAIREAGGEGIEFVCTQCRARTNNQGGGGNDAVISQLSVMVQSLCAVVAKLTEQVDHLCIQSKRPPPSAPVTVPSGDDLRITIREEIVEMEERRKRRDSLIFRGVTVTTNDAALTLIKDIVHSLLNPPSTVL